jgi:hypothetical protein
MLFLENHFVAIFRPFFSINIDVATLRNKISRDSGPEPTRVSNVT